MLGNGYQLPWLFTFYCVASPTLLQLYSMGTLIEIVAIDIEGQLPLMHGKRFICVCMDNTTKWPKDYVLPQYEAETVANVLVIVLQCLVCRPSCILLKRRSKLQVFLKMLVIRCVENSNYVLPATV